MSFHVGMKVVCIDANLHHYRWPTFGTLDGLTQDRVYTVRAIGPFCMDRVCLWLDEIRRPETDWGEGGYRVQRFRPVVDRPTDISIFTRMLTPTEKVRA